MASKFVELLQAIKPDAPGKIVAWGCCLKSVFQWIINFINNASNLDFTISAGGNPRMIAVWDFLNSTTGNLVFTGIGILWLSYLIWHKSNQIRRTESQTEPIVEPKAEEHEPISEHSKPKPNIICLCRGKHLSVELANAKIFRETRLNSHMIALAIPFHNAPNPPERLAEITNVSAHIRYYAPYFLPKSDALMKEVFSACWLNESSAQVSFGKNEIHQLIIGVMEQRADSPDGGRQFIVYENFIDKEKPLESINWHFRLPYRIRVNLSGGTDHKYGAEFDFELNIQPDGHFNLIYLSVQEKENRKQEILKFLEKSIKDGNELLTSFRVNEKETFLLKTDEWRKPILEFLKKRLGISKFNNFTENIEIKEYPALVRSVSDKSVSELYTLVLKLKKYKEQVVNDCDSF